MIDTTHSRTPLEEEFALEGTDDLDLGIQDLDDMIDPDFWDGFVVGAGIGGAVAAGAIAIGIAT